MPHGLIYPYPGLFRVHQDEHSAGDVVCLKKLSSVTSGLTEKISLRQGIKLKSPSIKSAIPTGRRSIKMLPKFPGWFNYEPVPNPLKLFSMSSWEIILPGCSKGKSGWHITMPHPDPSIEHDFRTYKKKPAQPIETTLDLKLRNPSPAVTVGLPPNWSIPRACFGSTWGFLPMDSLSRYGPEKNTILVIPGSRMISSTYKNNPMHWARL